MKDMKGKEGMKNDDMYYRLLAMSVLSFLAMYALMYAMVNQLANVFANFNQFYMAGLMTMPMVILELALMRGMYHRKALNAAIIVISVIALGGFWVAVRQQAAISDRQFLKSMIPHHAGAILMCSKARLVDPDILELCKGIATGQQAEIDQMKEMLLQLESD